MRVVSFAGGDVSSRGTCLALGMFDGVHIGHRRIITAAKNKSTEQGLSASVLLFSGSPHGSSAIFPLEDRLRELEKLGIDHAFVYDFDEIRSLSPEEFVKNELCERLGARSLFAGYNYRFGKAAAGDAGMLCTLAGECGMECFISERVEALSGTVSSTRIRDCLASGDIQTANALLGGSYYLRGEVVHGKELGRKLGLPTVNQYFHENAARLAYGIYYTKTELGGKTYLSVSNVGVRPTVENTHRANLETHIFGYEGNAYGEVAKVMFFGRGRGEKVFANADELRREIENDCKKALEFFEKGEAECLSVP